VKAKLKKLPKIRKPAKYLLWNFYQLVKGILETTETFRDKIIHLQCITTCANKSLQKPKRKME
jgi:hypothetical protein